jgi:ADP-ribosylation factor-binding protein GGA
MCEEESDDAEAVQKLLEINHSIRRTIERYKLARKGDLEGASKIPKGTLGTTTGVSKNSDNELSLIDFDPEPTSNGNVSRNGAAGVNPLEDDLLGLSFQDRTSASTSGPISLGFGRTPPCTSFLGGRNRFTDPTIFPGAVGPV